MSLWSPPGHLFSYPQAPPAMALQAVRHVESTLLLVLPHHRHDSEAAGPVFSETPSIQGNPKASTGSGSLCLLPPPPQSLVDHRKLSGDCAASLVLGLETGPFLRNPWALPLLPPFPSHLTCFPPGLHTILLLFTLISHCTLKSCPALEPRFLGV